MKSCFSKMRVFLCMFLVFTLLTPNAIAQAATATNTTGIVVGADTSQTTTKPQKPVTYQELAKQLGQELMSTYGAHGIQVAIMDHGKTTFSSTYGYNSEKAKTAPTTDTIYGVGSVSKIFTTVAVMQLVEQGKVELDKPVINYIPEFKMKDSRYKDITVRMLLNHSSGLFGSYMTNAITYNASTTYPHDNFLKDLKDQYLQFEPGTVTAYNNDGFILAELLVEHVAKKSYTEYVDSEICKPLGLKNTKTSQSKFNHKRMAAAYSATDPKKEYAYEMLNIIGAGGVLSTAEDLCKFGSIFMNNANTSVLSESSRKAMANEEYKKYFGTTRDNDMVSFGLGWDSVHFIGYRDFGITAYQKGGDTNCYHTSMTVLPDKDISISVTAAGGISSIISLYSNQVMLQYLNEKGELGTVKAVPEESYEKTDLPANIDELIGTYQLSLGSSATTVTKKDNTIVVNVNSFDVTFHYTKQGKFICDEYPGVMCNFLKLKDNIYLEWFETSQLPSFGKLDATCILGQKVVKNSISKSVKKAWNDRANKIYLSLNQLPCSVTFSGETGTPAMKCDCSTVANGYVERMKIINKDLAYSQIYGRNGNQLKFYCKNGTEYASLNGLVFIDSAAVPKLPKLTRKKALTITIPKTGYCQYYDIDAKMAKKTATIKVPKNASFVVYNKKGKQIANYFYDKKKTVKLPMDGTIVFIGTKNDKFTVTVK